MAIFWFSLMLLGFAASGFYSGTETGAYSMNRIRLHIFDRRGDHRASQLHRLLDNPTLLLSTLLVGNNLANYIGTASLAVILDAQGLPDWENILLNTLIVTPILFIFCETLPKDLFAAYSDKLMYPLARFLTWSRWLFTLSGLVPVIGYFSRFIMRTLGHGGRVNPFHPRRQVKLLVKEGVGYGLLSDEQSALVERVLDLANRTVGDEMLPWEEVLTVKADQSIDSLWQLADQTSRTRFPVLDQADAVVGILDITDVLIRQREKCPPVADLMQPATDLPAAMPVRQALRAMRSKHIGLAIVRGRLSEVQGIVTIKDLVEAVTGELTTW